MAGVKILTMLSGQVSKANAAELSSSVMWNTGLYVP